MSDDDIVAQERRRSRLWARLMVAGLLFWTGLALLLVEAFRLGLFQQAGAALNISDVVLRYFPMLLLVVAWAAFLIYIRHFRPTNDILRPGVQRKLVDDHLANQRRMLLIFVSMIAILTLTLPNNIAGHGPGAWYSPVMFVLVAALSTLFVTIGPGFLNRRYQVALSDELTRSLRSRAASLGYVYAMVVFGLNYLLSLAAPQWLPRLIPISMASLFAVPALYLSWLEWQAGRDG